MPKVKIKFTVEYEYELQPDYYPEGSSAEEMLQIDIDNMNNDPLMVLDIITSESLAKWETTGEVIK
jgi:hypothetical protein